MSENKLGRLVEEGELRDAIHIAIAPVEAGHLMYPGDHVGLDKDGKATRHQTPHIGIVDPFLPVSTRVHPGEKFWLCLYQQTIKSIRHDWSHPAFAATAPKSGDSEQWLRAYAERMNLYDQPGAAFERLLDGLRSQELFAHGSDLHGLYDLDDADDLKYHAERHLGIKIDWSGFTFACSC